LALLFFPIRITCCWVGLGAGDLVGLWTPCLRDKDLLQIGGVVWPVQLVGSVEPVTRAVSARSFLLHGACAVFPLQIRRMEKWLSMFLPNKEKLLLGRVCLCPNKEAKLDPESLKKWAGRQWCRPEGSMPVESPVPRRLCCCILPSPNLCLYILAPNKGMFLSGCGGSWGAARSARSFPFFFVS